VIDNVSKFSVCRWSLAFGHRRHLEFCVAALMLVSISFAISPGFAIYKIIETSALRH